MVWSTPLIHDLQDDSILLRELKSGSERAYSSLVETFLGKVINICYRFVPTREEAEDLAQEVFIEVFQSISSFRGSSKISTWIYQIAVRKSIDYNRRKHARKRASIFTWLRLGNNDLEFEADSSSAPDTMMEAAEQQRILYAAIAKLPDNLQTAFLFSKYDELSAIEISEIMKISVSAVNALVHRAKKELRFIIRSQA